MIVRALILVLFVASCASADQTHQVPVRLNEKIEVDEATIRAACDEYVDVLPHGGSIDAWQVRLYNYGIERGVCDAKVYGGILAAASRDLSQNYLAKFQGLDTPAGLDALVREVLGACQRADTLGAANLSGEDWVPVSLGWAEGLCAVPEADIHQVCVETLIRLQSGGRLTAGQLRLSQFGASKGIC